MTTTGTAPLLLAELASQYLPRLSDAQQQMMLATEIPSDVEDLVDEIAERLGAPDVYQAIDPYLSNSLLAALLAGEKGLRAPNVDDRRRRVRVALEQVRQVLRDVQDEAPASEGVDVLAAARFIVETTNVSQHDVAELLGVHVRTLQRWLKGIAAPEGDDEARVRMVARTVAHLRFTYTAPGVVRWFSRAHPELDGHRPIELLDDPVEAARLVGLASRSRSTVAS